jgi:hypothetical protein
MLFQQNTNGYKLAHECIPTVFPLPDPKNEDERSFSAIPWPILEDQKFIFPLDRKLICKNLDGFKQSTDEFISARLSWCGTEIRVKSDDNAQREITFQLWDQEKMMKK